MHLTTRFKRQAAATLASGLVAFALLGLTAAPASAAPSHQGTDPYNTGCAQSAQLVGSRSVAQGTLSVWSSTACGTNWIEYQGATRWVNKIIAGPSGMLPTENDNAPWSYSMQVYAPGNSTVSGTFTLDGLPWRFTCSNGCTWS